MASLALSLLLAGLFLAQDPTDGVLVRGRVVSAEDGSPVASGSIAISSGPGRPINLRIKGGEFSGPVPPGEGYFLMIFARGFADHRLNNVSVFPGMQPLTFKLRPTRAVGGQVVDSRRQGIPQATVSFYLDEQAKQFQMSVRADDDGFFHTEFAADPSVYYLVASKAGYKTTSPIPFEYPSASQLLIELDRGPAQATGSIAGTATMGGKPLVGRQIRLTSEFGLALAIVDSRGAFHFGDLAPGAYRLVLVGEDRARSEQGRRHLEVTAGVTARADFALFDTQMTGVLLTAELEPAAHVFVSLSAGYTEVEPLASTAGEREAMERRSLRKPVFHSVQTDEQGRFRFEGVEPGPYLLNIQAGNSRSRHRELALSVEVPKDDNLQIVLEPGIDLRGVLVDRDGSVVQSFGYGIAPVQGRGSGRSVPVNSPQGLFVARGLKPTLYTFRVNLPDGREAETVIDLNLGSNILFRMPSVEGAELSARYEKP